MENNDIKIDLRGFFDAINGRSGIGIRKSQISKTIKIQLDNYTLVIHGFLSAVQLPTITRTMDSPFGYYNENISDLELRFVVEHIEMENLNGEKSNNIDENSFRIINEILKSIS